MCFYGDLKKLTPSIKVEPVAQTTIENLRFSQIIIVIDRNYHIAPERWFGQGVDKCNLSSG